MMKTEDYQKIADARKKLNDVLYKDGISDTSFIDLYNIVMELNRIMEREK